MKTLWIRTDEVKEAQDFILRVLAPEGLMGEVPVRLLTRSKSVVSLEHFYDVSEDALFSLQENYGERNVVLTESGSVPESWTCKSRSEDPLDRIADALESIDETLESLRQILAGIIVDDTIEFQGRKIMYQDRKIKLLEKKISLLESQEENKNE